MLKKDLKKKFEQSIDYFKKELKGLRTGRAKPAIVESIKVDYYGTPTPLLQLASVNAPDSKMIIIEPWDKNVIKEIEKAIQNSDLSLNPVVEGNQIRLNIPPMTEERRKEITKTISKKSEEVKQSLRNAREEYMKEIKKDKDEGNISEDDYYRQEEEVQKVLDEFNHKIKDLADNKEKEVMTI
ncbi:MAG: ribosome recycling factor [Patescibacteria group bacterium]|nr:ribosome recycling factor [Patescibacteria group bacterium]